jgi:hypothetical protein
MPNDVEPAFRLKGLSLWIRGYEFPDATEPFDANWLRVKAVLATSSSHVAAEGCFLQNVDLQRFCTELEKLYRDLRGTARLASLEPNIDVNLEGDGQGHITMRASLTPDPLTQTHLVTFALDQTLLPGAAKQLRQIDQSFPIRGKSAGG